MVLLNLKVKMKMLKVYVYYLHKKTKIKTLPLKVRIKIELTKIGVKNRANFRNKFAKKIGKKTRLPEVRE